MNPTPYTDHLGNKFSSLREMCQYYQVSSAVFLYRKSQGWNLERCLQKTKDRTVCDHKGIPYPSFSAMCAAYHIPLSAAQFRLRSGWSLESVLTTPPDDLRRNGGTTCTDHLGNHYPSKSAMCACYGISNSTFNARIKKGLSLEDALTRKVRTLESA